ncbi:MAG: lipocalin family protein [Candidatus Lernaella stagnicola]|nr:lipocalin family protein [Candidatus Lernaella stagnicola]
MRRLVIIAVAVLVLGAIGCQSAPVRYPTISPDARLAFPRDHFAHPEFRTEWWYYNGRLETNSGAVYGFQLVFFVRRTTDDSLYTIPTRWYADPGHMAHFCLTDIAGQRLHFAERLTPSTAEGGDAGARTDSFLVWNRDWSAREVDGVHHLQAKQGRFDLALALREAKAPVRHGRDGFFLKSKGPDFARGTYYITHSRLVGEGVLTIGGVSQPVRATAWRDHEFGSHQLAPDQLGWDWFSLQFDDDTELMLYMLKQRDGSWGPLSKGTYVRADGTTVALSKEDIVLEPRRSWKSQYGAGDYQVDWRARIPKLNLEFDVWPALDNQEVNSRKTTRVIYWEGLVVTRGTKNGEPVAGHGYVELCGNTHQVHQLTDRRDLRPAVRQ